jgi:hypothetical protein
MNLYSCPHRLPILPNCMCLCPDSIIQRQVFCPIICKLLDRYRFSFYYICKLICSVIVQHIVYVFSPAWRSEFRSWTTSSAATSSRSPARTGGPTRARRSTCLERPSTASTCCHETFYGGPKRPLATACHRSPGRGAKCCRSTRTHR